MTSIPNTTKKIKPLSLFLLVIIVILGIMGAFFLGRMSVLPGQQKAKIAFEKAACLIPADTETENRQITNASETSGKASEGAFLASKSGTKYYPAGCKSADRILPENRVWFETEADAIAAGFDASTQCGN